MVEIFNKQIIIDISAKFYVNFAEEALNSIAKNKTFTIAFVTDKQIRVLNNRYRNKDLTTDVLSFPNESDEFDNDENHLGDIVISTEQAQKQASENDLPLELEIKQLILHGILHLCGYDHETDNGEMNKLELKLRDKLGIS